MRCAHAPTVLVMAVLACTVLGCERDDDVDIRINNDRAFILEAEVFNENEDDTYHWTTVLEVARVTFQGKNFHGSARVKIYGTDGVEIFDAQYSNFSHGDFQETHFTSVNTPGVWRIRIEVFNLTGEYKLIVDDAVL